MPQPTQLLIVGGGPAALEAALAVQHLAAERVRIPLLCNRADFVYRPVAAAEPFGFAHPERFSLAGIAADRGFTLRLGALRAVDADARRVRLDDDSSLACDTLLLALGAR